MPVRFDLSYEKMTAAVTLLASRNLPELSKGKLCKLLFLADRAHVVRYGRPIIGDEHRALSHGPILSATLDVLNAIESGSEGDGYARRLAQCLKVDRTYIHPHYAAAAPVQAEALSASDRMVLEEIAARYGHLSFRQLRELTHEFEAYKRAWERRVGNAAAMRFEDLFDDDDIDDVVAGVKEEMIENGRLRMAFPVPDCFLGRLASRVPGRPLSLPL